MCERKPEVYARSPESVWVVILSSVPLFSVVWVDIWATRPSETLYFDIVVNTSVLWSRLLPTVEAPTVSFSHTVVFDVASRF